MIGEEYRDAICAWGIAATGQRVKISWVWEACWEAIASWLIHEIPCKNCVIILILDSCKWMSPLSCFNLSLLFLRFHPSTILNLQKGASLQNLTQMHVKTKFHFIKIWTFCKQSGAEKLISCAAKLFTLEGCSRKDRRQQEDGKNVRKAYH